MEDPYLKVVADLCRSNSSGPQEMGIMSWKEGEGVVPGVGVSVVESHQQLWRSY